MFNKFIKSILNESELQNDGFVNKGKEIFLAPITDFFKGYYFEKVQDHFYLNIVIAPIYSPEKNLPLTYGKRLKRKNSPLTSFEWSKENDNAEIKAETLQLIKESKKDLLDINTPIDFYNKFKDFDEKDKKVDTYHHKKIMAYTLCYASNIGCCEAIDEAIKLWETSDRKHLSWMQEIADNLQKVKLVCNNTNERERLFRDWKIFTIKNLGLEKYM